MDFYKIKDLKWDFSKLYEILARVGPLDLCIFLKLAPMTSNFRIWF